MSSRNARSSSAIRPRIVASGWPAKFWLKKLVASTSCDCEYARSVCRMRFCTSPSAVTRISSTRRSDSRRNSRWRNAASRRLGVITTPANWVSCDRRPAAALTSCCGRSATSSPSSRWISVCSSGFDHHQAVDEEAVALGRRHAARRRVRAGDEAHLLQVRHHVADRRRRQLEAGVPRQRARAHRLAVADVALDQRLEEVLCPCFQHADRFYRRARSRVRRAPFDRPAEAAAPAACGLIGAMPDARRSRAISPRRPGRAPCESRDRRDRCRALADFLAARGHQVVIEAETAQFAPVPGLSHGVRRGPGRRRRSRDRARRRRDDALDRAAAGAVRRAVDRHQPGPPGLPHRHSAGADGSHARRHARGTLCRGAAHAARRGRRARRRRRTTARSR